MDQKEKNKRIKACFLTAARAGASKAGQMTDDTQMAMFTAEGLVLSRVRFSPEDTGIPEQPVFHALLRWLYTQHTALLEGMVQSFGTCAIVDGMLMGHKALFRSQDPSGTCLEVLEAGMMGTLEYPPRNNSRGPGALARNLPVGLVYPLEEAFQNGMACAVITHGHQEALLCSGYLCSLVSLLINGMALADAFEAAIETLREHEGHESVLETLYEAKHLSMRLRPETLSMGDFYPDRTACHVLGAALFFAMTFEKNPGNALKIAAQNAPGSESVEIAGAILGAMHDAPLLQSSDPSDAELESVINELADDLISHFPN